MRNSDSLIGVIDDSHKLSTAGRQIGGARLPVPGRAQSMAPLMHFTCSTTFSDFQRRRGSRNFSLF